MSTELPPYFFSSDKPPNVKNDGHRELEPQHRASGEILTHPHHEPPAAADVLLDCVVHAMKTSVPINLKDGPEHTGVAFQHVSRENHGVRYPKPLPARDERMVAPPTSPSPRHRALRRDLHSCLHRKGMRRDLHGAP